MRRTFATLAVTAFLAVPGVARAQSLVGGGLAFHDDFDFGVGVFGATPLPSLHENVSIGGDVTFFFPDADHVDYLEINANLFYRFPLEDPTIVPWVMGGLNFARISRDLQIINPGGGIGRRDDDDTELGLNAGGGVTFNATSDIRPLVGAKVELNGGEGFVLFGGLAFVLGG